MAAPRPKAKAKPRPKAKAAPKAAAVSPLLDPTAVLAGQPLQHAAQQVTDLQYRPQLSALDTQSQNTRTQYGGVASKANDYYKGLAAEEAKGIARQQALGDWLKTAQAGVGQATQGAFHDMSAGEAQRESQDASVRGAGLGGGGGDAVANTIAATQGRAATLQQGAANAGVEQAGDWANLANAISAAHTLRGTEQQGQIQNKELNTLGALADRRTALQGERGNALTKNLLDLRQQGFTNLATTQGLGLNEAKLAQAAATSAQSDRTRNRAITTSAATATANRTAADARAAAGRTAADRRAANKAAGGPNAKRPRTGLGSISQQQENAVHGQIGSALGSIKQYAGKLSLDQIRSGISQGFLTDAKGKKLPLAKVTDPLYFQAALEIYHGGLTPDTAKKLQTAGIHLGGRYPMRKAGSRPKPKAGPPAAGPAGPLVG